MRASIFEGSDRAVIKSLDGDIRGGESIVRGMLVKLFPLFLGLDN